MAYHILAVGISLESKPVSGARVEAIREIEVENLSTMDKLFTLCLYTFLPPKKGQPLKNGKNACPQRVHYLEVPL